jgi:hypothetical protein
MIVSSAERSSAASFRYGELNGNSGTQTFDQLDYYLQNHEQTNQVVSSKFYVPNDRYSSSPLG